MATRKSAQLPDATPEVGYPLHLQRQPADADFRSRWSGGLAGEADAKELGIADNDWIEVFNSNGALTARAVVSQRVPAGMTMMYHAQERIVNLRFGNYPTAWWYP